MREMLIALALMPVVFAWMIAGFIASHKLMDDLQDTESTAKGIMLICLAIVSLPLGLISFAIVWLTDRAGMKDQIEGAIDAWNRE